MNISEILETIKPYDTLGMRIENEDTDSLAMSILLNKNLNDKNTMFAGSIYSVMVLCGWALAFKMLNKDIKSYDVVIKHSNVEYILPVKTDAMAIAKLNGAIVAKTNKNKSVHIRVQLQDTDDKICAEITGEYIGICI